MARSITQFLRDFLTRIRFLLRRDVPFYLFIAVYTLAGLWFLDAVGALDQAAFLAYRVQWPLVFGVVLPMVAFGADGVMIAIKFRKHRMLAARRLFSPSRMAHFVAGLALLMAFSLFQGDFTSIKNGLPVLRGGFVYDTTQADLDALIHFGTDPWRFLYMIGEYDIVRTVVEWNYNVMWFLICFGVLFFVATSPTVAHIRSRYLVCFCAVWVLIGNLFAGAFLSAGPAFHGLVTGDTARFAEQLAFLAHGASSPNSAVSYQHYLWNAYESGKGSFGSGISAFPSIHVALITLNALFLYEQNRKCGIVAFVYVLFVAASSVYLAWHYAIDGYVSIMLTAAIYYTAKKWAGSALFQPGNAVGAPLLDLAARHALAGKSRRTVAQRLTAS